MLTVLTALTIVLAVVYVLVLAVTLILVTFHLMRAARLAETLASGLEKVDEQTAKVPEYLPTINGALVKLLAGLKSVDGHLAAIAHVAGAE